MVDFHSHILPGVDHGAASLDISVQMLKQAKKAGVAKIVATPHFYPRKDNIESFLERRNKALKELEDYIALKGSSDIKIIPAAEVALDKNLLSLDLRKLAIGNTNYILIEMPQSGKWYSWMFDILYGIESEFSLSVILAHVDRYTIENIKNLLELDFITQMNAESLVSGTFLTRRRMRSFCKKGLVHLIGSDAHDLDNRSYRDLILLRRKLPTVVLDYFDQNANLILK